MNSGRIVNSRVLIERQDFVIPHSIGSKEFVYFCRDEFGQTHEVELAAVHLVFFNHFLGPALLIPRECEPGFAPSAEQRRTLREIAFQIVGFNDQWRSSDYSNVSDVRSRSSSTDSLLGAFSAETQSTTSCRRQYEAVLEIISRSSAVESSYDPNEATADVDCELMGMCLMNVHSLLDNSFPEFQRLLLQTQTSTTTEQTEGVIIRTTRLLKALGWPLANFHQLVECARPEVEAESFETGSEWLAPSSSSIPTTFPSSIPATVPNVAPTWLQVEVDSC